MSTDQTAARLQQPVIRLQSVSIPAYDPAFAAGYELIETNKAEADGYHGSAPWWHGWGIRVAFWAGVLWERARARDSVFPG